MSPTPTIPPTGGDAAGFLRDERGHRSSARLWLSIVLTFTLALIALASCTDAVEVPAPAWALLTAVITYLAMGAWGPRIAQYISPAAQGIVESVSQAARAAIKRRDPALGIEETK